MFDNIMFYFEPVISWHWNIIDSHWGREQSFVGPTRVRYRDIFVREIVDLLSDQFWNEEKNNKGMSCPFTFFVSDLNARLKNMIIRRQQ